MTGYCRIGRVWAAAALGLIYALGGAAVAETPGVAPGAPVVLAHDEQDETGAGAPPLTLETLPQWMRSAVTRDSDKAIRQFSELLKSIAPDSVLTQEKIEVYQRSSLADVRASEMRDIIQFDLNFDGIVTEKEVSDFNADRRTRTPRVEVEIMLIKYDADDDGALSYDEIRAAIREKSKDVKWGSKYRLHVARVESLLHFDLNADGEVTVREIVQGVHQISQ